MTAQLFKVGDKVYLSPRCKWVNINPGTNPLGTAGFVTGIWDDTYDVDWGNGVSNGSYTDGDLILAQKRVRIYEGNEEFSRLSV